MKILKNLGSLAFVLLIAGSLQAGGHASSLKWYSDGGVDLITFEDKEVIHLSKEQLGSYFGKGKQPYKGKKIAITVNNSGPKGGISGPLHRLRPAWEELTGAKLEIVEMPLAEQLSKTMFDLRLGSNQSVSYTHLTLPTSDLV